MTVGETRRKNLRAIIEKQGGVSKLSRQMGYSNPSFLSQMAGPKPTREITEKSARKLEAAMDLPMGALDRDETVFPGDAQADAQPAPGSTPAIAPALTQPSASSPGTSLNGSAALVAEVVRLVGGACEAERVAPSMSKFADVVAIVYQDAMGGAKPSEEKARLLARLLK